MDDKPNIVEAMLAPQFFHNSFKKIESWKNWIVFLKAIYGLPMDENEKKVFMECTGREPREGGFKEVYAICGRRGGKSRIASFVAVYEAVFGDYSKYLGSGEKAYIFIIATDREQARICFDYVKGFLEIFPGMVEKETREELQLRNRINISVKTCSFKAGRGFSTAVIICDELAFWRSEDSANPAQEVIASLLPGLMPNGLLFGTSTPYGKFGYLYETHKEFYGKADTDILVWQAGTRVMNATYSENTINRLKLRDRVVYTAEYDALFREDVTKFIPEELLDMSMIRFGPTLPELKNRYVAFVDPSGGRSDSMTLAIAHVEGKKIIVDLTAERIPPFDPDGVCAEFATIIKEYGLTHMFGDQYAGVWVDKAFQKIGVKMRKSPMIASDLYLNFQPLLAMGKVEMPIDEKLRLQFLNLERKTTPLGKDHVHHPQGAYHDDISNAVAGAVVMAHKRTPLTDAEQESMMPIAKPFVEAEQPDNNKMMTDWIKDMHGSFIVDK